MKKLSVVAVIIFWLGTGYVGAGGCYSYFMLKYPTVTLPREEAAFASAICLTGPMGFLTTATESGFFEFGITWDWFRAPEIRKTDKK